MATSPVEVCNIALRRLGADPIVSFTEGTKRSTLCAALYQPTVDRLLREHTWNFAQFRVALNLLATAPAFGYEHQYSLPTNPLCLKVNETDPDDAEYDIENTYDAGTGSMVKVLVTDAPTLSIRYTGRVTDVSIWDASFLDTVASDLETQMARPITEDAGLEKVKGEKALNSLQHARSVDSKEGSTKQADINILTDVRRQGFQEFTRNRNVI